MQIELSEQERQIILAALNSTPVKGVEAMLTVLRLVERLTKIERVDSELGGRDGE